MNDNGFSNAAAVWSGSHLIIDEGRCINVRGRMEICKRCVKACPADALRLTIDKIDVSDECTDCGACLPACPAGALRLRGFSPLRFLNAAGGCEIRHLHCQESHDGGGGVIIPCHLVLDARLLAALGGTGIREIHFHGLERCEDCRRGSAVRHLERIRRTLARWFGDAAPKLVLQEKDAVHLQEEKLDRQDQVRLNRRGFFTLLSSQAAAAATAWIAPADENEDDLYSLFSGELPPAAPDPYQEALRVKAMEMPWRADQSLPWYWRRFDEACTLCMVCAERCPTGALKTLTNGASKGIGFADVLCTNCGLCGKICPHDAIHSGALRNPSAISSERIILKKAQVLRCSECGQEYVPETKNETLCMSCRKEQDIEDEWISFLEG